MKNKGVKNDLWNGFLLAMYRLGNSLKGLKSTRELKNKLSDDNIRVGVEGDLKWIKDGGDTRFYLNHGIYVPGTTNDLIKDGKELAIAERNGKVLSLEQALNESPDLFYLLHVKRGVGESVGDAMYKAAQQFENKGLGNDYSVFSNSISAAVEVKKAVPNASVGSIHRFNSRGRVTQFPDSDVLTTISKYGFLPRVEEIPLDYVITPETDSISHGDVPYIAHRVKSKKDLTRALDGQARGAFVYASPEKVLEFLEN